MEKLGHLFLLLLVLISAAGCGGGTTGSGDLGPDTRVQGIVVDASGKPLSGVQIVAVQNGDSAITQKEGIFQLDTPISSSDLELLVTSEKIEKKIVVKVANIGSQAISITIEVDSNNNSINVISVSVVPVVTPTPAVTPKPVATKTPTSSGSSSGKGGFSSSSSSSVSKPLDSIFKGIVFDDNKNPIAGVRVSIEPTIGTSVTNHAGSFEIKSKKRPNQINFILQYKNQKGSIRLSGLPTGQAIMVQVRLSLTVIPPSGGVGTESNHLSIVGYTVKKL